MAHKKPVRSTDVKALIREIQRYLSYLDALCTVDQAHDPGILAAKALAAHSILFAFLGVPAVYYHSLVGSPPDLEGMVSSRINRRINRAVLDADRLGVELLEDPRRRAVFVIVVR